MPHKYWTANFLSIINQYACYWDNVFSRIDDKDKILLLDTHGWALEFLFWQFENYFTQRWRTYLKDFVCKTTYRKNEIHRASFTKWNKCIVIRVRPTTRQSNWIQSDNFNGYVRDRKLHVRSCAHIRKHWRTHSWYLLMILDHFKNFKTF